MEGTNGCALDQNPIITREWTLMFSSPFTFLFMDEKANWKRRAEIIDYCVQVLDDKPPDHRSESGDARSPHPPLSVGVSDEAKVRYDADF